MTAPHILVVDDESDIRSLIQEILTEEGYEVSAAADAAEARKCRDQSDPDLILLDIWMPDTDGISLLREWSESGSADCPVVMMSGHGTVDTAVEATRLGAADFIEKPLSLAKLLRTVEKALETSARKPKSEPYRLLPSLVEPVGRSDAMRELRERARQISTHDAPVLIVGEQGTGREAFARFMHEQQHGDDRRFIAAASGLLTDSAAESRLFGSEDGDNVQAGLFEQSRGGTLFINELADLSKTAQMLIVAAIEEGSFVRGGGSQPVKIETRIMASVGPEFESLADGGELRRDLLAALNVLSLHVPPLRDYAEDVPELLRYYVDLLVERENLPFRRFGIAAQNRLRNYPWPDNVRGLRNLVQRLLIAGGEEEVSLAEIEAELAAPAPADEPLVKQDLLSLPLREAREQFERAYLTQQLILCDGKVGKLSQRVGMERTHLYRKLRSLGVDFRQTAGAEE